MTDFCNLEGNNLFLHCDCGEKTLISKYMGQEKLQLLEEDNELFSDNYLSFEKARDFIREKNLKNIRAWRVYRRDKPTNIPLNPHIIYKNQGWINYDDWLGKYNIKEQQYLSFEEAREIVRTYKFYYKVSWNQYIEEKSKIKKHPLIPNNPEKHYRNDGWISWKNWLGCEL